MAKKKDKKASSSRTDSVRQAVEEAFRGASEQAEQAQLVTRERAQEIADDLTQLASRVREAIDDLRPPSSEDLKSLASRLDALEARLARIEKPTARRAPAKRAAKPASKPAAKRATARKPASRSTTRRKTSS